MAGNISSAYGVFGANVLASGGLYANNQQMYIGPGGNGWILQLQPNFYFDLDVNNGNMIWVKNGSAFFVANSVTSKCGNEMGPMYGYGAYEIFSDERIKSDIRPSLNGLREILRLSPIRFRRKLSVREEDGFSAQDVRGVMPDAVSEIPTIEGSEPTLAITLDPIVAALVNGMKELAADVAALKAAR